ncbi:MAG TPA: NAD(P)H-hydrate dehydratase [Candidatus Baltobacteraceae bacterium]|nr:NAD(P)H-hydrate dehydratase [Candidatus Baltobacteraceae bacterium]
MRVLTPAQMREADAQACAQIGEVTLMRTAGDRIAEVAARYARSRKIVAFAGTGNNGGDAFAALALLQGYDRAIYAQDAANPSPARRDAEARARVAGVERRTFPDSLSAARDAIADCGLVIVGLVGTGARLPVPQPYGDIITAIDESNVPSVAIDIPPGVDGERGTVVEPALRASATVTLGALKSGLLLAPGRACAGDLWLGDIGMPQAAIDAQPRTFAALDDAELLALLPARAESSDKRSSGAPLVIAGSQQFPGAAVLTAMGAARAGAGYVTLAAPQGAEPALRAHLIEQVVVTIDASRDPQSVVEELLDVAKRNSSIAIGPGLSLDDRTGAIVRGFVKACELPIVADASALFHFAKHLEMLRGKRIVLTPHEGEFARLSGKGTLKEHERVERLREFVDRTGITTLLKGQSTLIYDGTTMHANTTGTAALATAGTGDVLTGIIATLLSQGLSPVDAARAGAYWHGLAGKHAAVLRPRGVIARDVYESLAAALPKPPFDTTPLQRIF